MEGGGIILDPARAWRFRTALSDLRERTSLLRRCVSWRRRFLARMDDMALALDWIDWGDLPAPVKDWEKEGWL